MLLPWWTQSFFLGSSFAEDVAILQLRLMCQYTFLHPSTVYLLLYNNPANSFYFHILAISTCNYSLALCFGIPLFGQIITSLWSSMKLKGLFLWNIAVNLIHVLLQCLTDNNFSFHSRMYILILILQFFTPQMHF